jgi:type I restriction enzyme S subunit
MKLAPYPQYKDFSLPRLEKIPAHWNMWRNGRLFSQRNETGFGGLPVLEVSLKTGVCVRDMDNLKHKQVMSDYEKYKRAVRGDIAYNMMRMWQGAVGVVPIDGLVSPAYVVAQPFEGMNCRYFTYLFRTDAYMEEVNAFSRGIVKDRNRLYWQDFKQILSTVPPREEQDQIVRYLDWKVSLINRLINAKRRQVALLNEQKQAVVNDAVTRGGVGWSEIGLGNLGNFRKGFGGSRIDDDADGVACIRYGDIYRTGLLTLIQPITRINIQASESYSRIFKGEIAFALSGETKEEIGQALLNEIDENTWCSGDVTIFAANGCLLPKFLVYCFRCPYVVAQRISLAKGDIIVHLSSRAIQRVRILVPPLSEQEAIVEKLDKTCVTIDKVISAINDEITLFTEYRTRLIADVVTGKVDVRGVAVPEYDASGDAAANEVDAADEDVQIE